MTSDRNTPAGRLRSTLAYLDREIARRAGGAHPGMLRLHDDELGDVAAVIRREVETAADGTTPGDAGKVTAASQAGIGPRLHQ